jgi:hypothetical protein
VFAFSIQYYFLNNVLGDVVAWKELSDLYKHESETDKAIYCMEEVLLAQPKHSATLCQYAMLQRAKGSTSVARRYYGLAAEQCLLALKKASNEREHRRLVEDLHVALDGIESCLSPNDVGLRDWLERKRKVV